MQGICLIMTNLDNIRRIVLLTAPRILGQVDRDENSKTFGCSDRYYWKYKFHDYPNARFQESALLFALLYSYKFDENIYFNKANVAKWSLAACKFWLHSRNNDGSCKEAYPFERSFCGTSFSTWSICSTILTLRESSARSLTDDFFSKNSFHEELLKTANFLLKKLHFEVSNQTASAALALQTISMLTNHDNLAVQAKIIIETLINNYNNGLRFPEYKGFDLGYATITLSCICRYLDLSGHWPEFRTSTQNIGHDISCELNDDASFDASQMSRGTKFLYPYGIMSTTTLGFQKILHGLNNNTLLNPMWMDDRYCIPYINDYILTLTQKQGL